MNYNLNVQNGKVGYLVQPDNSFVLMFTTEDSANWMLQNADRVSRKTIQDQPQEYAICAEMNGKEYYFNGTWEKEPSIFDEGEKKPRTRRKKV
jgi:hypothetical protein